MPEYNTKQKNLTLRKLKLIGITNEKDIANIKVSDLRKINDDENIQKLNIKDIEIIWAVQEAIENKSLLGFFTDEDS